MPNDHSIDELVSAYFEFKRTGRDDVAWAWEAVDAEGFEDPERKWTQVLALLAAAPDDWEIGLLAAGPLEELLRIHGSLMIDSIEAEALHNARLRLALSGTWLRGPFREADPLVAERVEQILEPRDSSSRRGKSGLA